jgi:hypothetical protein
MGRPRHQIQLNRSRSLNTRGTITASTTPIATILIAPALNAGHRSNAEQLGQVVVLLSRRTTTFVFFRSSKTSYNAPRRWNAPELKNDRSLHSFSPVYAVGEDHHPGQGV